MTRLFSILTTETNAGGGFAGALPVILLVLCAVILAISIIVGCKKGAKRVSWAGLVWLCAVLAYFLLYGLFGKAITEGVEGAVESSLENASDGYYTRIMEGLSLFAPTFLIAIVVILVVMLVYGLLSMRFRPRIKMVKKNADTYVLDEDGVEYDEDYKDYDDYETYTSRKMPMRLNCETPRVGSRLIGALLCLINTAMVLVTVLSLGVFLLYSTSLKDGALSAFFTYQIGSFKPFLKLVEFASKYALDAFFIGILIAFMCKGRRKGMIEALRGLTKYLGLALGILCLCLPFTVQSGGSGLLYNLTARCINACTSIFGESASWLSPILGRVIAGLLLLIADIVLFVVLHWALGKLSDWTAKHRFTRLLDGAVAALVYLLIGMMVCLLVWGVWCVLARYGIFNVQKLFTEEATLSNGLYKAMSGIVDLAMDGVESIFR